MRMTLILVILSCLLLACKGSVDYSNPKSVVEQYLSMREIGDVESEYEFLADTCKEFTTLQDYIEYYSTNGRSRKDQKFVVKNIDQLSFNPNYPKHRNFEIHFLKIKNSDKDTINGYFYYSAFNENGKWKVVWTNNIKQAAQKFLDAQKFTEAINCYRNVLQYDPLDGDAYRGIGWGNQRLGKYDKALTSAEKAIELGPKDWNNINLMAVVHDCLGNHELGIKLLEEGINKSNSEEAKHLMLGNLATILLRLQRFHDAHQALDEALKIDSTRTFIWYVKGRTFKEENNLDSAIACYQKAVTLEAMNDFLQRRLHYELAKEQYKKAEYNSSDYSFRDSLLTDAKNHILHALELDSDNISYNKLLDNIDRIR